MQPGATSGGGPGGDSRAESMAVDYASALDAATTEAEAKDWYARAYKRKADFGAHWPLVEAAKDAAKARLAGDR